MIWKEKWHEWQEFHRAVAQQAPEKRGQLIALQAELKTLVHQHEPDAIVYELFQSEDDPDLFQVVATFRDDAAFEHHMKIDFHERLVPPILECVEGDMKLDFIAR